MPFDPLDRRSVLKAAVAGTALAAPAAAMAAPAEEPAGPDSARGPATRSADGGAFARSRLSRIDDALQRHVDSGHLPGAVALVSRRGDTHIAAAGTMAFDSATPMRPDTIGRIASVSKPIAAAAAMTLVEEGRLRLDDPVDDWLPELADRKVLRSLNGDLKDTVPAHRPISLRDLLTMRFGLGAIMAWPPEYPIQQAMLEAGVAPGPHLPAMSPDAYMDAIGRLPLAHQPGERWLYDTGMHVLGILLARASGMSLGEFLNERLFAPLGMIDTGFSVAADDLDRLATCYWTDPDSGEAVVFDEARGGRFAAPPAFESASGGLISTVTDLLAFGTMMLDQGVYDGTRILSRAAVEVMTRDHIPPDQKGASHFYPGFWDDRGWGLGMAVVARRDGVDRQAGSFGWDGGYGTSFYCDPAEGLVGVLITQRVWDSPVPPPVLRDFWTATYQALAD